MARLDAKLILGTRAGKAMGDMYTLAEQAYQEIDTALWPLERPAANVGVGVILGDVTLPALADLADGERVVLVEPNDLYCKLRA